MQNELKSYDIVNKWKRDALFWVKTVVGIGLGKCTCNPPCGLDTWQTEAIKGYSDLVHAKIMVNAANVLSADLQPVDVYRKVLKEVTSKIKKIEILGISKEHSKLKELQKRKENILKSIEEYEPTLNRIRYIKAKYGWAESVVGISMQSAKGVGKTMVLALVIMHFYSLFEKSKGIATAPKIDLLKDNLKSEIKKWVRHSKEVYGESSLLSQLFDISGEMIAVNTKDPKDRGSTQFCAFRTANINAPKEIQRQTLQGYHEDFMLNLADEASGLSDIIFDPIMSTATGICNLTILSFNPNRNTGFAIETQRKFKKLFLCYQISAFNSKLVTKAHIENMRILYADNPNGWRVNVEGVPPTDEDSALIPYSKIIEATQRDVPYERYSDNDKVAGFDIGAGGDLSSIAVIQGFKCHGIYPFSSSSDSEIEQFGVDISENEDVDSIGCDGIGLGFLMPALLKKHGINAVGVDSRKKVFDKRFYNLRAKLYWDLREWIIQGGSIPNDELLINELAVLKVEDKGGKIKIISKAKLKQSGIKSPNKADSLMLAMYFTNKIELKAKASSKQGRCAYKADFSRVFNKKSWLAM